MTSAVLALVLSAAGAGAVSIKADPPQLVLGKDAEVQLEVTTQGPDGLPLANAKVTFSTSVGEISPATPAPNGHFKARFLPPKERMPAVALILVAVQSAAGTSRAWLALPLQARANLKIETKPRSQVTVTIAGVQFGPVVADGRGNATVPAVVPPGIPAADVRAVDRAGNSTVKPLELPGKPFPLVRALSAAVTATWAGPARIEVYAISANGKPLVDPKALKASATLGKLEGPVAEGDGVFALAYGAPDQVGAGKDTVTVSAGDTAPPATVTVKLAPGAPARVKVDLKPARYVAGSEQAVAVNGFLVDARDNPLQEVQPVFSADFGDLRGRELKVPNSFGGRKSATVHATAGAAKGEAALALDPGPPAKAEILFEQNKLTAGDTLAGKLTLVDGFGNLVERAKPQVVASTGRPATVEERGAGLYAVSYPTTSEEPWGPATFEVKSADATLARSAEVTVLPYRRPWAISLGVLGGGQSNLVAAHAVNARVVLGLRLGRSAFDVIAEGELVDYATVTNDTVNKTQVIDAKLGALMLTAGAAYSVPMGIRASLKFSAVVGVQGTSIALRGTQLPGAASPVIRVSGGPAVVAGPGQFELHAEYSLVRIDDPIHANLGGLGVAAGYVFSF